MTDLKPCPFCGGEASFKPLVWEEVGREGTSRAFIGLFGVHAYKIILHVDGSGHALRLHPTRKPENIKPLSTTILGLAWFKAAAQADFERRVKECLV